jgi:hypothetical protein
MNNRALLTEMAQALKPLLNRLVFVGGCAVDLLVDDNAADNIRITGDVDVIAEITSISEYYLLIEELRSLGFSEVIPTESSPAPICRLSYRNMLLDVMPTDDSVLGFSNIWYLPAVKNSTQVELEKELTIRVITPAYFIATKLVAFRGRGEGDYYCHDMEDIITIFNGKSTIVSDIECSDSDVRRFISDEFSKLIKDINFKFTCIAGHLSREDKRRVDLVYERIRSVAVI